MERHLDWILSKFLRLDCRGKYVKVKSLEILLAGEESADKKVNGDSRRELLYLTCLLDGNLGREAMHV